MIDKIPIVSENRVLVLEGKQLIPKKEDTVCFLLSVCFFLTTTLKEPRAGMCLLQLISSGRAVET